MWDHGDDFGSGLANIGDLDGDGNAELMVSAPFWTNLYTGGTSGMLQTTALNDSFVGALFILSLNDDGTMKNVKGFPGDQGSAELTAFYENYSAHTYLGYKMANIGDLNLDGNDDVAVTRGSGSAIEIYYLNSDGSLQGIASIGNGIGGVPADTFSGATYSLSVDGIGDFDSDGVVDLMVGDEGDGTLAGVAGASYRVGAAFVLLMNADGSVKDINKIADGVNGFPSNELQSSGYFGGSVLNMGFSTNGFPQLAVGEYWANASSGQCRSKRGVRSGCWSWGTCGLKLRRHRSLLSLPPFLRVKPAPKPVTTMRTLLHA